IFQAYENIRENFQTTFSGIITICFSLVILGTFTLVYLNLISLSRDFFQQSQYSIFLEENTNSTDRSSLYRHLEGIRGVENIRNVSSEQNRLDLLNSLGEASKVLKKVTFQKLPELIEFDLKRSGPLTDLEMQNLESLSSVDEVVYGQETQDQISTLFNIANFVGIFLIMLFVVSISFIIQNSIQIAVRLRIKEIELLKILGATLNFICWPYVWEGCFIALISFILSLGGIYLLFQFIVAGITFNEATYSLREAMEFFPWQQIMSIMFCILLLSAIISYTATRKLLLQSDS
ncbi:MAG: FtsX-like permease family protein, partial [Proteobacteria bacterium]|nr:FtsX-like permease family protein [Pseudomonadota bacterium]